MCAGTCCCACVATQLSNELETQGLWEFKDGLGKTTVIRNERTTDYIR
jgi:hypothetical protein